MLDYWPGSVFFYPNSDGAMAEQLGSGLQNRVHRCDSGSRLHSSGGEWWNGIHDRLKICWASAHVSSTLTSPTILSRR